MGIVVNRYGLAPPAPLEPRAPEGALQSATAPPGWARWTLHPGDGLTPRKVVSIFRAAEWGQPIEQCDLFEDVIENDGHLRSQIETRTDSVAGKEWIIQSGGDSNVDHQAAEVLADALASVDNIGEMLEHQLTAAAYGYSGSEILWGRAPNGSIAPRWFANVPHRCFTFDLADDPRLLLPSSAVGVPLAPGRYMFSRRRHRLAVRAGYMRAAVWWALFKRMAIRDWVTFCTRFGIPFVFARYRDDLPEAEKETVRKAVEIIHKDGYAAFSDGADIQFAKAEFGGSGEVHPALAAFCNAELSKLITGATLTSGEGTSAGSYALGRVHENVSFNIVLSDAQRLGLWFAQQIGKPFCAWNGFKARAPRLRFHVVREVDPQVRLDILSRAANELGVTIDEDQFRQEFQIKKPMGAALTGSKSATAPLERPPRGSQVG